MESRKRRKQKGGTWCTYTEKVMRDLGLELPWMTFADFTEAKPKWRSTVVKKIQGKEQREWRERMEGKPKLRTYRMVKQKLEREDYLLEGTAGQRRVMTMIRGGTNDLRIERGRYERVKRGGRYERLKPEERMCLFCDSGEVEDEKHFLCDCERWSEMRKRTLRDARKRMMGSQSDLEIMMTMDGEKRGGDADCFWEDDGWKYVVMKGVAEMYRERERVAKREML